MNGRVSTNGPIRASDVTVVLPTRNEEGNIGTFLASIPSEIRLVVVDASTDGTSEVVEQLRPRHTTVLRSQSNIATARQLGSVEASTPWLLFTDADVAFDQDYFQHLAALQVDDVEAGIVGTKLTVDGFDAYHRWFRRGQRILDLMGIPAATGSNIVGPFVCGRHQCGPLVKIGGYLPS